MVSLGAVRTAGRIVGGRDETWRWKVSGRRGGWSSSAGSAAGPTDASSATPPRAARTTRSSSSAAGKPPSASSTAILITTATCSSRPSGTRARSSRSPSEELAEIITIAVEAKKLLDRLIGPNGYNIGVNLGRAAGAGLDEHFHLHVVPRWSGDTNFVTTVGSVKVIPQALEELWRCWTRSGKEGGSTC